MRRFPRRRAVLILLLLAGCRTVRTPDYRLDKLRYAVRDETEHFEIYLEDDDYGAGFRRDLPEWMEEIYRKVGRHFDSFPEAATTVKIYSTPQPASEGLEYFGYAGKRAIYSKKYADTRRNLAHEYTHFIVAPLAGIRLPTWFNEGLATFVSNHLDTLARPTFEEEIFSFVHGDFLLWAREERRRFDLIVSNPPFALWAEFVEAMLPLLAHNGEALVLAFMNIVGSAERVDFWRTWKPYLKRIWVSHRRYSKPGTKGGDPREVAWFHWVHPRRNGFGAPGFDWLDAP